MEIENVQNRSMSLDLSLLGEVGYDPRAEEGVPIGGLSGYLSLEIPVGGTERNPGAVSVGPQFGMSGYWGKMSLTYGDGDIATSGEFYPTQEFSGFRAFAGWLVDVYLGASLTLRTSAGGSFRYENDGARDPGCSGMLALVANIVEHFNLLALLSGDIYNMNRDEQVSFGIGASVTL